MTDVYNYEKITFRNIDMRSCRSDDPIPFRLHVSHLHSAWAQWKWHNNCLDSGQTCLRADFSAAESSVMNATGAWCDINIYTLYITHIFTVHISYRDVKAPLSPQPRGKRSGFGLALCRWEFYWNWYFGFGHCMLY